MDFSVCKFRLDDRFIKKYVDKQPKWGPLGEITYRRTYSRPIDSISKRYQKLATQHNLLASEEFWLTLVRVIEGTYRTQEAHCKALRLPWNPKKAQRSAQEMYYLMWEFKFLPPGRGLWMMGTEHTEKIGGAALTSCSAISTEHLNVSFSDPFCFLMDMSMLGIGVGSDTRGAGTITIRKPRMSKDIHVVADSREGWVEIVRRYLDAYVGKDAIPEEVDFSQVRPEGSPIKGFGGTASGSRPLAELLIDIQTILNPMIDEVITSTVIVDLFNLIARCVVAGNVRRSATILFGQPDDEEFLDLKDPSLNKEALDHHRWCSNNSVLAKIGQDYKDCASRTVKNGEPGYLWLENARAYGRMKDSPNWLDKSVMITNPCGEIGLSSGELCNLVEVFMPNHDTYQEFERTLKFAYLYAKTVTLISTHNPLTNAIVLQNRRIGTSLAGVIQAFAKYGKRETFKWCDQGYSYLKDLDDLYSRWLCVPKSIKLTTCKPGGTIPLLAGITPGITYPHSKYYFRVIRFATNSLFIPKLKEAGYNCIEIDPAKEPNTTAVYFAIKEELFNRGKKDISIWEQLENVAQLQYYWTDNQVSYTATFKKEEAKDIPALLELYETRLKGISFLPLENHGFEHTPYQEITEEEYISYTSKLKPLNLSNISNEIVDKFCDGTSCEISK